LQFGPAYPAAQEHVYELTPSLQTPRFAHGLVWQSYMSTIQFTRRWTRTRMTH